MNTRPLLLCLVFLTAVVSGPAQEPAKAPEVPVVRPLAQEVTDYEVFTGRTAAAESVDLRARVSGYLVQVNFRDGSDVKKGDLLFVIDPRPYQAKLDQAGAALALAGARLQRADADFKRAKALFAQKAMSREEFDRATSAHAEAEAEGRVAKAALAFAKLNLDFTQVRAPMDGHIGRRLIDPGNVVREDKTLLATLAGRDPLYAYLDMDERTLLSVRRAVAQGKIKRPQDRLAVHLGLPGEAGYSLKGVIDFVNIAVNPKTGSIVVRAVVPNPKNQLLPGLSVRVRLPVGGPYKALLVPDGAVLSDQGEKFVYVVNAKDVVESRKVQLGSVHGALRVVKGGLQSEDRVVTGGLHRVRPGMAVRPKLVSLPGPEAL